MRIRKRLEQLKRYNDTSRLLIHDLENRHLQLVNRIYVLEQMLEKLQNDY
jgi:hypothetical protein